MKILLIPFLSNEPKIIICTSFFFPNQQIWKLSHLYVYFELFVYSEVYSRQIFADAGMVGNNLNHFKRPTWQVFVNFINHLLKKVGSFTVNS